MTARAEGMAATVAALALGRVRSVTYPMHTKAEGNARDHHMAVYRRGKAQKAAAAMQCRAAFGIPPPKPPLGIKLTRIGMKLLDEPDNLSSSLKATRDGVALYLRQDDGPDVAIFWDYDQEKCPPKTPTHQQYAVRIDLMK